MARADADEISVLEDVSGRALTPAERGGHGWDNKRAPVAVWGLSSSLQSSKSVSRRD